MHIEKTNGEESVLQGSEAELQIVLEKQKENDPSVGGTTSKKVETMTFHNGTRMTVTDAGLLIGQEKKKRDKNRKKNKAARVARRKGRR